MISGTIGRVMFPALSSIQDDKQRVAALYLRMTRTIALVTFPMMMGLWILSDHFVLALFGPKWAEMIPILSVFCWTGMLQSISTLNGNLYRSQGRTDLQFKVEGLANALGIVAIIIGLQWGIEGVANAYTLFILLATYPTMKIAISLVGLTFLEVVKKLAAVFACASGMVVMIWLLGMGLPASWPHWAHLVVQTLFGGALYLLLLHLFKVEAYQDIRDLLLEQWQSRKQRSKLARGTASSS
jgi:PST family polysaccharide transporter